MSSNVNAKIAAALVEARRSGIPADDGIWSQTALSQVTQDDIYQIHDRVAAELGWTQDPAAPSHWKGGGPGPGSVAAFSLLPPPWVRPAPGPFRAQDFKRLAIEIEVAFRLARDVEAVDLASRSAHDPAAFLDAMAVSIELVDFRWANTDQAPAALRNADLQSNGALVVGDWVPMRSVDWSQQVATLEIDGAPAGRWQGSHAAGDPLWFAPQWLEHAVQRHGRLAEGSVLTTGSWCGMVWLPGRAEVKAVFEGIGEARLTLV
ncbi:2-keto-4-pentenoate hydratase [Xylophilus rhododendri]|uniref:2-keto-4-pentenoate hydratase n=1 Tax=Xylophilus rhododendri TaxID=2697032 RepID=A0A857J9Z1_9BURK|nr:fumarylacetoacetate hydrolase family protein [Xylophilus rhododendri]QHJ00034.1 2-keto-4-pentenoate hydratase [Xylophilus rhododendri]